MYYCTTSRWIPSRHQSGREPLGARETEVDTVRVARRGYGDGGGALVCGGVRGPGDWGVGGGTMGAAHAVAAAGVAERLATKAA